MPKRMFSQDEKIADAVEKLNNYRIARAVVEWLKDNEMLEDYVDPDEEAAAFAQLDEEAMYEACKIVRGR